MVLHVTCLTSAGLPLFSRSTAGLDNQLNFTTLAPLNGIQLYGKAHSVAFKKTDGEDFVIYWKNYHGNLCFILVGKHLLTVEPEDVLDATFNVLLMVVGLDEILNMKNADRFKKEIKASYPLIDRIMRSVDENNDNNYNSDLLSLTEVIITTDNNLFQKKLEEWSESIGSLFGCLILVDKVVVATSAWWDLSSEEKKLFLLLVTSYNDCCTSSDIPVFLPHKSPSTPFRLVSCCLTAGIWVLALCGPVPDLVQFEECSAISWNPLFEHLKLLPSSLPRNIPQTFNIQPGVIAFLLINVAVGKYVLTGCLNENKQESSHLQILRTFYYQNVKSLIINGNMEHKVNETYWYADHYKIHAFVDNSDVLSVMYSSTIPTSTMRIITKEILSSIKNDNSSAW